MSDHQRAMLAYAHLADIAHRKQQSLGAVKFLVLTGAAACRAGWLDVAEQCSTLVLHANPNHIAGRSETFADAMRNTDFQFYVKQLERFCGYERAEHLLEDLDIDPEANVGPSQKSAGEYVLTLLSLEHWLHGSDRDE